MVRSTVVVVHVIPADMARGAQTYLRALLKELAGSGDVHRTVILFGSGAELSSTGRSLGVQPGLARRLGFDPRIALRLRRALRELRPDVIVCHGGEGLKYAVPVRPNGVALVYYKIGMVTAELRNPLRRLLYLAVARRSDVVAAVSDEAAREVQALISLPTGRVVVIPNGRDPDQYRPPAVRNDPPRLVFVGHLTAGKRPHLFLEVVRALQAEGLGVHAVVVGDGPLEASVRTEAAVVGAEVLGRRDDVAAILATSHILVFTSIAEGMPGVLIEAGLTGIPVVTTDVPGARAIVEDGESGFVVGLDDVAGLIGATRRLLTDPELRQRMGDAGRARCLAGFTMEASGRRWQALLDSLLVRG